MQNSFIHLELSRTAGLNGSFNIVQSKAKNSLSHAFHQGGRMLNPHPSQLNKHVYDVFVHAVYNRFDW